MNRKTSKLVSINRVFDYIRDGTTLMFGGFGGVGTPPTIVDAILDKGITDLSLIGNDAGFPTIGIGRLISQKRVKKLIASHIGSNPLAGELMTNGQLEVEFSPQGTLAERIRAGGVGLGGVLIDIGVGSQVERGKETIKLLDKAYLIETALTADVAIVYARKADEYGNLVYDKSARNTNPLVAMAGDITIAEVEEVVASGDLDPECIVTPGIHVDMIVRSQGVKWSWPWE